MFSIKSTAKATSFCVGISLFNAPLYAETLRVEGLYPANAPGLEELQTISVERFGGSDGVALAFEIEDVLSGINIYDSPYFQIIGGRSAIDPDATMTGTATAGIDKYETTEYRSRCIERNDKDKCVKRKDIKVSCLKRVIDFNARIRMARFSDGQTIYSASKPDGHEQTICFGDDQEFSNSEAIVRKMIAGAARSVRYDIAPTYRRQNIRVLESRKAMEKAAGKYFKAAVKMTKSDAGEACRMWDEAARNSAPHVSVTFNRGLCAEQKGDLETALNLYSEAEQLRSTKAEVRKGLSRIEDRLRAEDGWNRRLVALAAKSGESENAAK